MKFTPIFIAVALALGGCGGGSGTTVINGTESSAVDPIIDGSTFVSNDPAVTDSQLQLSTIDFTSDSITLNSTSGGVEQGTYTQTAVSQFSATFPDREVEFELEGDNVTFDEVNFVRTASSLFDSQASLEAFFDGDTYFALEQSLIGEPQIGGPLFGQASLTFQGNEIQFFSADTIDAGIISFIDDSSFLATFFTRELTVVVLENEQLVFDDMLFELDADDLFPPEAQPVDPEDEDTTDNGLPPEAQPLDPEDFGSEDDDNVPEANPIDPTDNGADDSSDRLPPEGALDPTDFDPETFDPTDLDDERFDIPELPDNPGTTLPPEGVLDPADFSR